MNMGREIQVARAVLEIALRGAGDKSMMEIMQEVRAANPQISEASLRAAAWMLAAEGKVDLDIESTARRQIAIR